jgi:hypothetical protein
MEMNDAGLAAKARDTRQNDVPNVRTSNTIYRSVVSDWQERSLAEDRRFGALNIGTETQYGGIL